MKKKLWNYHPPTQKTTTKNKQTHQSCTSPGFYDSLNSSVQNGDIFRITIYTINSSEKDSCLENGNQFSENPEKKEVTVSQLCIGQTRLTFFLNVQIERTSTKDNISSPLHC